MPGEHVLLLIKGSVSYTWASFRAGKAQKGAWEGRMSDFDGQIGIRGTPTTILGKSGTKAKVGRLAVKAK